MKIVSIVGARPQFIKAALVSRELRKAHQEILVHTGQHYDAGLSQVFFDELDIPEPAYNLGVGSDTHGKQTGKMMPAIEAVLVKEGPDMVLVYGDTNSTLAGAVTATKLGLPVAHVEAGPRMFDKSVPEEVNRVLTDHISSLLFAPTQTAVDNLNREGISRGVYLTGDVMLDSFLYFSEMAARKSRILSDLRLRKKQYLLVTVHRARNTDNRDNLESIVTALSSLEERIVFPLHPRTRKYLELYGQYDRLAASASISLIPPVGYLDSIVLARNASKVLTDSGGLQKEAYFSGVPCITIDEATSWPETLAGGWNTLAGARKQDIITAVRCLEPSGKQTAVFGDGNASQKIGSYLTP
ncbi:MAG: UDP-N-acetylglucosamine 2-epimerase (non-hydrolyzing) [Dehalococcoidales bacterium]|nr:UDP-N-acetylglucosamine 2-epimerase (non-hydrolyzing) [Dehalococcoidales bacterium]